MASKNVFIKNIFKKKNKKNIEVFLDTEDGIRSFFLPYFVIPFLHILLKRFQQADGIHQWAEPRVLSSNETT